MVIKTLAEKVDIESFERIGRMPEHFVSGNVIEENDPNEILSVSETLDFLNFGIKNDSSD